MQLVCALLSAMLLQSASPSRKPDRHYDQLSGRPYIVRTEVEREPGPASKDRTVKRNLEEIAIYDQQGFQKHNFELSYDCVRAHRVFSDAKETKEEAVYWGAAASRGATDTSGAENVVRWKKAFTNDDAGNWTSVYEFGPDGNLLDRTDYSYEQQGRLIETKTTDRSKKLLEVCSFKYNATGQIEEETCTRPEGFPLSQTHSYKYELDSQGSWTKRTGKTKSSFESKTTEQALPVKYRKIEYYASGDGNNSDATVLYAEKIKSLISSTAALAKPCSPLMIRKSRGVLEGSATRRVMPEYPAEAKRQRIGGPVLVEVTIDETGKVIDSRVISGPLELRDAAGAAAKRWTFQPTYLSKVPTKVIGVITFNFNL